MPRRGQGELHNSAVIANTPVLDVMDQEWTGESDQGRTVIVLKTAQGVPSGSAASNRRQPKCIGVG